MEQIERALGLRARFWVVLPITADCFSVLCLTAQFACVLVSRGRVNLWKETSDKVPRWTFLRRPFLSDFVYNDPHISLHVSPILKFGLLKFF
jgi:hypothetical protein